MVNWQEVEQLMSDKTSQTAALGWFDPKRMKDNYNLAMTYLGVEKPFDVTQTLHQRFPRRIDQDESNSDCELISCAP